jgi:hypothetical protein
MTGNCADNPRKTQPLKPYPTDFIKIKGHLVDGKRDALTQPGAHPGFKSGHNAISTSETRAFRAPVS